MMHGINPGTDVTWRRIKQGSVGAELGVWKGDSTEKFIRNASKVYAVDSWSPVPYEDTDEFGSYENYLERYSKLTGSKDPKSFAEYYDKIYNYVVERFKGKNVVVCRMTTGEWFNTFEEKLDWVYVDASHAYEGCLSDLRRSLDVVKPGGIIYGDDYGKNKQGVTDAVDQFVKETGLLLNNFHFDQYEIVVP